MITNFKIFETYMKKYGNQSKFSKKPIALAFKDLFEEYYTVKLFNFYSLIRIESAESYIGYIQMHADYNSNDSFDITFSDFVHCYLDFYEFFKDFLDNANIKYTLTEDEYDKNDHIFEFRKKNINEIARVITSMKDDFRTYVYAKKYNL